LVNLTSTVGGNVESRVLTEVWREAARKFGDVKFCEIRADMCIEGYPERNTPTILVYKDGDIKRQIVTLAQLNGVRTGVKDIGGILVDVGAIRENDARLKVREEDDEDDVKGNTANDADDDEWD